MSQFKIAQSWRLGKFRNLQSYIINKPKFRKLATRLLSFPKSYVFRTEYYGFFFGLLIFCIGLIRLSGHSRRAKFSRFTVVRAAKLLLREISKCSSPRIFRSTIVMHYSFSLVLNYLTRLSIPITFRFKILKLRNLQLGILQMMKLRACTYRIRRFCAKSTKGKEKGTAEKWLYVNFSVHREGEITELSEDWWHSSAQRTALTPY